jgi:hypothetical protein
MQLRVSKLQKSATAIWSVNDPFAREWVGGVDEPLTVHGAFGSTSIYPVASAHDELIEQVEILRVRGCFALRSSHSAKDESRFRVAGLIVQGEESSGEERQSAQ